MGMKNAPRQWPRPAPQAGLPMLVSYSNHRGHVEGAACKHSGKSREHERLANRDYGSESRRMPNVYHTIPYHPRRTRHEVRIGF